MKRLAAFLAILILGSPALALAEEHGGYRGIGTLYFTFMGAILIYGVYDASARWQCMWRRRSLWLGSI